VEALTIAAFGTLQIRCGDAPVKLPTRKDEALLLYLAQTARPHPREQLAEMLWENRAPA
jgi:DNA-binding SARP family transcriptional activator